MIDYVGADDLVGMSRAISDNSSVSFLTTMLGMLGLIFQLYGVSALGLGIFSRIRSVRYRAVNFGAYIPKWRGGVDCFVGGVVVSHLVCKMIVHG